MAKYTFIMHSLEYIPLSRVNSDDFITLLNNPKIREHLIGHDLFDHTSLNAWIKGKAEVDAQPGCKVRAIILNGLLIGWCGIQLENGQYEIAIIISDKSWGIGKTVFQDIMGWAKELGHSDVFIHFLETRPEYNFLKKISKNVYKSELYGRKFTTYQLEII